MKVFVYYNLHKKCWSIKHKNKVIGYADTVLLKDCSFQVSETGRKRVLRERKKNVHAGVTGTLVASDVVRRKYKTCVTYNPYKRGSFYEVDSKKKVLQSKETYLAKGKAWI